jgi:hypothetical protein
MTDIESFPAAIEALRSLIPVAELSSPSSFASVEEMDTYNRRLLGSVLAVVEAADIHTRDWQGTEAELVGLGFAWAQALTEFLLALGPTMTGSLFLNLATCLINLTKKSGLYDEVKGYVTEGKH